MSFENAAEVKKITPEEVRLNIKNAVTQALADIKEIAAGITDDPRAEEKLLGAFNARALANLDFKNFYEKVDAITKL